MDLIFNKCLKRVKLKSFVSELITHQSAVITFGIVFTAITTARAKLIYKTAIWGWNTAMECTGRVIKMVLVIWNFLAITSTVLNKVYHTLHCLTVDEHSGVSVLHFMIWFGMQNGLLLEYTNYLSRVIKYQRPSPSSL